MLKNYPPQIKYIVGNEAAERFSFYGMKSILIVFMTQQLLMAKNDSVSYYHSFTAACYLLPLIGAYVSDRFLGKYKTIMLLSSVYCLGHLVLALFESKMGLLAGLSLIAIGAGGIKPCVSAHVGDQFKPNQKKQMENVFNLFYWMINFGAFFATLLTPFTYAKYGSQVAFGIPGVLMMIATFVFWLGRDLYVHVPATGKNPHGFMNVIWSGLKNKKGSFVENAVHDHPREIVDGAVSILKLLVIYVWISMFWALFDQNGSTWVIQAQKMDLNFLGIEWKESQIQAMNPILILVLIPIFVNFVYPSVEKIGIQLTSLRKIFVGMLFASASYFVVAYAQGFIEAGEKISIQWQLLAYLLLTIGEVMVSVTGLEFAYTQAPKNMKSTIMSFWLLTVFIGNIFASQLAHVDWFETASKNYFIFYAVLMLLVAIIFLSLSRFYKVRNYMVSEDDVIHAVEADQIHS
ncbi:MAG: POT family MFS transporter [Bdellovibrionaceae bacterium]|nr:POT family MFS transporter [Pseudobdellovibrionaceae bacterium]NUM59976.1 POT family MFS transporter [Pseudobdellovibrionaceae bacterium]